MGLMGVLACGMGTLQSMSMLMWSLWMVCVPGKETLSW